MPEDILEREAEAEVVGDETPQPRSQREKLAEISHEFAHIPVRVGTQQAGAIETIREAAQTLAKQIAILCPEDDPATRIAIERALEAKFWAVQALSHRGLHDPQV